MTQNDVDKGVSSMALVLYMLQ